MYLLLRTRFLLTATNGIGGKGNGAFMKHWIGAAAVLLAAGPAVAADVATCSLSADKKTVTVIASNPYSQVMACSVNCHMAIPNGMATVICVKQVPVGAKDFVMCSETAGNGKLREDNLMVHDLMLVEVKKPEESKYPWDYYKILAKISGDEAFGPIDPACAMAKK